jgi:hypothetical protein
MEVTQTTPIAQFEDKRCLVQQRFELFPDHLIVSGSTRFFARWHSSNFLRSLNPAPARAWMRPGGFGLGLFVGVMCLGLAAYWLLFAGLTLGEGGPWVLGIVGLGGFLWTALSARRREYSTFNSDAGVPLFSIRRPSGVATSYDAFLDALIRQIRVAKGMAPS